MYRLLSAATGVAILGLASATPMIAQADPADRNLPTVELQQSYQETAHWAKLYIEANGFSNVQNLRKDLGGWTATATQGGRTFAIDLDEAGGVREHKG